MQLLINDEWLLGEGEPIMLNNPSTGLLSWEGKAASLRQVDDAIKAASAAFKIWSSTALAERINVLHAYAQALESQQLALAECISEETGKPLWESKTEVTGMIGKIAISVEAYQVRTGMSEKTITNGISVLKHKPLGVMGVLGPFNFPGHLPNGHIVPALLAGNTIVFKPSELTPQTAIFMMKLWQKAGLPAGVLNLILGKGDVGQILTTNLNVKGILFTGSYATGKRLYLECADQPEKLLALEMGGNNPLIVSQIKNKEAAAYNIIQSAFITAGQRCTCARRLIIPTGSDGDELLSILIGWMDCIRIGHWRDEPEPFMGPVISVDAANAILKKQEELITEGGEALVLMRHLNPETGLLSPALIDVTANKERDDTEIFGPLLQVIRVADFEEALRVANETHYGLVAGLQSDSRKEYEQFYEAMQVGVLSWNRATTGASSAQPFGGIGWSGNYRPSGYYAADYCAYPVSSSESSQLVMPAALTPGLDGKKE
ncbi:MAG: succinylglutamate-semialdehyde dehydrogenase [Gammaproteobacteria bacterium]|nr:succinylglutamate-semialdehyde dehydrogenase [Gammaproteobacteria bacterium]